MSRSDRTYILAAVFILAAAIAYCGIWWFAIPLPRYYPTQHDWKWVKEKGAPSQGWYGMQAFAYLVGAAVTAGAWLAMRWLPQRPLGRGATRLIGLATVAGVVFAMGVMLHHEFTAWGILK